MKQFEARIAHLPAMREADFRSVDVAADDFAHAEEQVKQMLEENEEIRTIRCWGKLDA